MSKLGLCPKWHPIPYWTLVKSSALQREQGGIWDITDICNLFPMLNSAWSFWDISGRTETQEETGLSHSDTPLTLEHSPLNTWEQVRFRAHVMCQVIMTPGSPPRQHHCCWLSWMYCIRPSGQLTGKCFSIWKKNSTWDILICFLTQAHHTYVLFGQQERSKLSGTRWCSSSIHSSSHNPQCFIFSAYENNPQHTDSRVTQSSVYICGFSS